MPRHSSISSTVSWQLVIYNFSGKQCAEEHIHEKFQAVLPKNKGSSVTTNYIWACKLKRQSEFWPHCLEAALARA